MSRLVLEYVYDESHFDERLIPDDFGRLTLAVETDRFSGTGGYWVQWQDVRRYGERLSAFPITSEIADAWGGTVDGEKRVALAVSIAPATRRAISSSG